MKVRAHIVISGRVQGVFYRASTRDIAQQLGVTGWVRNTSEGNVEVVVEGEEQKVKDLLTWCHSGPRLSIVSDVNAEFSKYLGEFEEFTITY